jgi:hypothetical protein
MIRKTGISFGLRARPDVRRRAGPSDAAMRQESGGEAKNWAPFPESAEFVPDIGQRSYSGPNRENGLGPPLPRGRVTAGACNVAALTQKEGPLAGKGPVAQWLEPAAHNGLVAGSSPAGPTISCRSRSGQFFPASFFRPEFAPPRILSGRFPRRRPVARAYFAAEGRSMACQSQDGGEGARGLLIARPHWMDWTVQAGSSVFRSATTPVKCLAP